MARNVMARNDLDMFTMLDDPVLIAIFSSLTFKEISMTSVLSKRCLRLWRQQCPNVEFNENLFVDQQTGEKQRTAFIDFARQYITNYAQNINLQKFSLTLSKPREFRAEVKEFVNFSLSRNPKNFSLDFSDPQNQIRATFYTLPKQFYKQRLIESLKLFACNFHIGKLKNFSLLRELSLGYINFNSRKRIRSVLENCNSLESLTLKKCSMDSVTMYSKNLKILVLDENEVSQNFYWIQAEKLRLFKFCGNAGNFESEEINWHSMEEADLDLEPEHEFDKIGKHLYKLMKELHAVRILKVCSYILQVLPSGKEKFRMKSSLNVRHLILKSEIHMREFCGIKFLLESCPVLEKLTILITPARNLQGYKAPYRFDPTKFWVRNIVVTKCLQTLKTVEIIGFKGTENEISFLAHLCLGEALRQLVLYPSREGDDGGNMQTYVHKAQRLRQSALAHCKNLNVSIY